MNDINDAQPSTNPGPGFWMTFVVRIPTSLQTTYGVNNVVASSYRHSSSSASQAVRCSSAARRNATSVATATW